MGLGDNVAVGTLENKNLASLLSCLAVKSIKLFTTFQRKSPIIETFFCDTGYVYFQMSLFGLVGKCWASNQKVAGSIPGQV